MNSIKTENVVTQIKYSIGKAVEEIKQSLAYVDRLQSDNLVRNRINTDRHIISYQRYLNKKWFAKWFGKVYTYEEVFLILKELESRDLCCDSMATLQFSKTLFKHILLHNVEGLKSIEDRLNKLLWLFMNYEYNNDEVILDISDLELVKFYRRESSEDYYIEINRQIEHEYKKSPMLSGGEKSWEEINKDTKEEDR